MRKRTKIYLIISSIIAMFFILIFSSSVGAVSVGAREYATHYIPYNGNNYIWSGAQYNGFNYAVLAKSVNLVEIRLASTTFGGNYVNYSGQFNLVGSTPAGAGARSFQFVNRDYFKVSSCYYTVNGNNSGNILVSQNTSTALTNWEADSSVGRVLNTTMTVYFEATLKDLPTNSNGTIQCYMGNESYAFFTQTQSTVPRFYIESSQNSLVYSSNINESLLNTQIAQNNQIINNQQTQVNYMNTQIDATRELKGSVDDLNNNITDSNISGSFNVQPVPAFGPVATLINNILELPRILLNIDSCSPITATLPFVREDITIPCMSSVFSQAYPAFILFLDTITSAYIWFRVARYIVRQVQHLRDPEQEDEEYLDI